MTVAVITVSGEPDPCLTSSIWTDGDGRSINCHVNYDKCDRYMEPGWHRVQSESGQNLTMPTFPVPVYSCGTKYPIWLKGDHPSLSDDIVDRVACVTSLSSTCHVSYQIRIKNCQDFMAYYLVKAKGCNERYCFGNAESCPQPTTQVPTSLSTEVQVTDTGVTGEPDPCLTSSVWNDGDGRSINCHVNYDKCDRYMEPGWYRVQSESGENLTMPTSPVPVYSCGTKYPIWLNGDHPSLSDDIVDRVACVTYYNSTCHASYQIRIKNCQDFMAYYLVKAKGCNERYCFGDTYECKTTPKSTTWPITTNTGPFDESATFRGSYKVRPDPVLYIAMAVVVIFLIGFAVAILLYIKKCRYVLCIFYSYS
ncbi:uncharacterized protein LOC130010536 [Patella vulgata]|uniref:uncharacterized protein LOC130010536 n=1 Tax=Patella vulgata TaxID=6465 RepID=UPI0024A88869|nr:uncharacterized protein LOC130010536 [Patella vulgata]